MMESIQYVLLVGGMIFCAYRAMISRRILPATLYLASISALTATTLYLLGATQVAMIELSVGAGLVTVLLVYALSVVGEDTHDPLSVIPKPLAFALAGGVAVMMGWMAYPLAGANSSVGGPTELASVLWQQRMLDVWIQIALIFSGVLGVLGLLSEKAPNPPAKHEKISEELSQ
jgi:uncharacterized MnhB-related membrane protein